MDFKAIAIKVFKGAFYGAFASVSALFAAGFNMSDPKTFIKGLAGAAVAGALHGGHEAVSQALGK